MKAQGHARPAPRRRGAGRAWTGAFAGARTAPVRALLVLLALGGCGAGGGDAAPASSVVAIDRGSPDPSGAPGTSVGAPEPTDPNALPRSDVREIDEAYPYRENGRYAAVLARCSLIADPLDACSLTTLPFVVQDTPTPTVEDVMERVLVTHDWMGERFETLLARRSAELLPLLGSITSITIGSTVRPSNYWTGTGGIQLDPAGLWLTLAEKANVSVAEDFRAPFRVLLGFRDLSTMRVDGESIFDGARLDDGDERTLEDIELPMMSLLFHELAHAADYLPPGAASLLDPSLAPNEALGRIADVRLSSGLDVRQPLNSELLLELAEVRFRGAEPTASQRAVSGTVAGGEMAMDGATHFYSYTTIREDFANLFEVLQMKRLFDADVHVAFSAQPADPTDHGCAELLVEWGVLNRLGDPGVAERARDATESIYGADPTLDAFLERQRNTQRPMESGVDWCTNLDRSGAVGLAARSRTGDGAPADGAWPSHAERHAIMDARRRP